MPHLFIWVVLYGYFVGTTVTSLIFSNKCKMLYIHVYITGYLKLKNVYTTYSTQLKVRTASCCGKYVNIHIFISNVLKQGEMGTVTLQIAQILPGQLICNLNINLNKQMHQNNFFVIPKCFFEFAVDKFLQNFWEKNDTHEMRPLVYVCKCILFPIILFKSYRNRKSAISNAY